MGQYPPLVIQSGQVRQYASGDDLAIEELVSPTGADLTLTPASGKNIILGALKVPNTAGTAGQVLATDGTDDYAWTNMTSAILANTTLYVATTGNDTTGDGTSGNPWATLGKALSYLDTKYINPNVTVTISMADGTYTLTSAIEFLHPCCRSITITGANTYSKSCTSVESSSGSSGDWSIILNMSSVANIAVDDYVSILTASGGTYPERLCGCHKVTNVDGANTRITLAVKSAYDTAPSGAVASTFTIIKTVLAFNGCNGFTCNTARYGAISKLAVIGNRTGSTMGIYASSGGTVNTVSPVGISGFAYNVRAVNASFITCALISSSYAMNDCYRSEKNSAIFANSSVASGSGGAGFDATLRAIIECQSSITVGCASGLYAEGGFIHAQSATVSANTGMGAYGTLMGYLRLRSASITYNGSHGVYLDNASYAYCYLTATANNGGWGYAVYQDSFNYAVSSTSTSDSSGDYSPAINTEGNVLAYNHKP